MLGYQANGSNPITRRRGRFLFVGMLCLCAACAFVAASLAEAMPPPALTENHYAGAGFSTHMPILVMEMAGEAQEGNGFFFEGIISTHDGDADNTLDSPPTVSRQASVRNMTSKANSQAEKCDYYLRFDSGQALLGLGEAEEYMLLGAKDDRSLIRNYLGYRIAAGIMDDAPGYQLCEVFFRTGEGDRYQGVYLLVEKNTPDTAVLFYHGTQVNGIFIDTYSSLNSTTAGRMYIPFMENIRWEDRYAEVIGSVSTAESVLFSSSSATYYTYVDLFDVGSFVNRFILGELMEDYIGVTEGYYYYDTATGLFSAAPIWNFDLALDNQDTVHADVSDIQYDAATYYEQFFKSHQFATQVQQTYLALRREMLDEHTLTGFIDEAAAYVAPAVQRDWDRWSAYGHHALSPILEVRLDDGTAQEVAFFSRQSATFEGEILRLKYQLREHSLNMAFNLTGFDFSEKEISKEIVLNTNPVWLILFLVVFFSLIRFARRYGV